MTNNNRHCVYHKHGPDHECPDCRAHRRVAVLESTIIQLAERLSAAKAELDWANRIAGNGGGEGSEGL